MYDSSPCCRWPSAAWSSAPRPSLRRATRCLKKSSSSPRSGQHPVRHPDRAGGHQGCLGSAAECARLNHRPQPDFDDLELQHSQHRQHVEQLWRRVLRRALCRRRVPLAAELDDQRPYRCRSRRSPARPAGHAVRQEHGRRRHQRAHRGTEHGRRRCVFRRHGRRLRPATRVGRREHPADRQPRLPRHFLLIDA